MLDMLRVKTKFRLKFSNLGWFSISSLLLVLNIHELVLGDKETWESYWDKKFYLNLILTNKLYTCWYHVLQQLHVVLCEIKSPVNVLFTHVGDSLTLQMNI